MAARLAEALRGRAEDLPAVVAGVVRIAVMAAVEEAVAVVAPTAAAAVVAEAVAAITKFQLAPARREIGATKIGRES